MQHPHILPLLDSGNANGLLYYVMPHIAGESLRDRLTRETQLPLDDALRIAREIADALGHAHGHGVIHRDIKPENILLQGEHALVADFGIALAVQSAGGARLAQTGLSLGTPQYMRPEQAMGEKTVDHRADIYALGAVTYEMLTGDPPFTGTSVQAVVAKVLSAEPERLTLLRKTIPPHVEYAVLKALAKLPADRWGSATQFASSLSGDTPGGARTTAAYGSVPAATVRRAWPRALAAGAASVALLGIGWAVRALVGRDQASDVRTTRLVVNMPPGVTVNTGETHTLAISRDGKWLAYSTNRGLELRALDSFASRVIETTGGAWGAFCSPDGKWVVLPISRANSRLQKREGQRSFRIAAPRISTDNCWITTKRNRPSGIFP